GWPVARARASADAPRDAYRRSRDRRGRPAAGFPGSSAGGRARWRDPRRHRRRASLLRGLQHRRGIAARGSRRGAGPGGRRRDRRGDGRRTDDGLCRSDLRFLGGMALRRRRVARRPHRHHLHARRRGADVTRTPAPIAVVLLVAGPVADLVARYAAVPDWFVPGVLAVFVALSCVASAVGGGALAWTGRRLSRAARSRPPA